MEKNNTDSPKIKDLQFLYNAINIDIERDDSEPIVYKGKSIKRFKFSNNQVLTNLDSTGKGSTNVLDLKPDTSSGNSLKMDTDRELEREVQLKRKYDERVSTAINIWEKYPDCSKPPMSNPNPKIGLHELKAWAKEEIIKAKPQKKGGEENIPEEIKNLQIVIQALEDWNKEDAEFNFEWCAIEGRNGIAISSFLGTYFIGFLDTLQWRYNLPNHIKELHDDFASYLEKLDSEFRNGQQPDNTKLAYLQGKAGDLQTELKRYVNELLRKIKEESQPKENSGEKEAEQKHEGKLEPKAPEILQKILWVLLYGKKHWKLILLALLIIFISSYFVLPQFNIFNLISRIIKSIHL